MVALRRLEAELGNQISEAKTLQDGFDAGFDEHVNRWYGGVVEFRVKKRAQNPTGHDEAGASSAGFDQSHSAFRRECQTRLTAGSASILERIKKEMNSLEEVRARSIELEGDKSLTKSTELEA